MGIVVRWTSERVIKIHTRKRRMIIVDEASRLKPAEVSCEAYRVDPPTPMLPPPPPIPAADNSAWTSVAHKPIRSNDRVSQAQSAKLRTRKSETDP